MLGASTGVLIHTTLVALGLSALLAASVTAYDPGTDPDGRAARVVAVVVAELLS